MKLFHCLFLMVKDLCSRNSFNMAFSSDGGNLCFEEDNCERKDFEINDICYEEFQNLSDDNFIDLLEARSFSSGKSRDI